MVSIHVVAIGQFGTETLRRLQDMTDGVTGDTFPESSEVHPATWPVAEFYVISAWRPVVKLCRSVDKLLHTWRKPWLPVVLDHPYLRVGPLVVPGQGGCYHCFEKRMAQHAANDALTAALVQHYDASGAAGPRGFISSIAGMGAALTLQAWCSLQHDSKAVAGQVQQFQILSRDWIRGTVTGVHGCSLCGKQIDERTRSYARLLEESRRLLPHRDEVGV